MHNSVLPLLLVLKLVENYCSFLVWTQWNRRSAQPVGGSAQLRLWQWKLLCRQRAVEGGAQTGEGSDNKQEPLNKALDHLCVPKPKAPPLSCIKMTLRVFHFAVGPVQSCSSTDTPYLLKTQLSSSESKQSLQSRLASTAQVFLVVQWSDIFFLMLTIFTHNFMTVWRTREKVLYLCLTLTRRREGSFGKLKSNRF